MNSDTGGILGVFGFLVSMAGVIYTAINHKKIRCRCCGKDLDMSVDVDTTEEIKKKTVKEEAAVAASAAAQAQAQVDTEEDNEEDDEEDDESVAAAAVAAAAAKAKTRLNEVTAIRVMSAQRRGSISNDAYPDYLEPSRKKISKGKIVPIVEA